MNPRYCAPALFVPHFPPLSTLGVLGIVFVAIALKASDLMSRPGVLLSIIAPLLSLYVFNYAFSTVVARALLPRGDAIALVYGTVMRNLSIALALAMNAFGGLRLIGEQATDIKSQRAQADHKVTLVGRSSAFIFPKILMSLDLSRSQWPVFVPLRPPLAHSKPEP